MEGLPKRENASLFTDSRRKRGKDTSQQKKIVLFIFSLSSVALTGVAGRVPGADPGDLLVMDLSLHVLHDD